MLMSLFMSLARWLAPLRARRQTPRHFGHALVRSDGRACGGFRACVGPVLVWSLLACHDLTGGGQTLPAGTQDPRNFNTPAGAFAMWVSALSAVETAIPHYITDTGLLSDELEDRFTGASAGFLGDPNNALPPAGSIDERVLPEQLYGAEGTDADQDYDALQRVRGLANQAVGALATYDTGANAQGDPAALRSQLYAFKGYAEILLADFFCSGIPLSTLDYQKDFTYRTGSPRDSVYWDAIHTLDTAYTLAGVHDSAGLQDLALVLLGRAYLDLDNYAAAGDDVATIPDGFAYTEPVVWLENNGSCITGPTGCSILNNIINAGGTIADRQGQNGVPFLSSGDPRSTVIVTAVPNNTTRFVNQTFPTKYRSGLTNQFIPFTLADWVEARLIQAEVALHTNQNDPTWLTLLNTLRQTAPIPGTTQPATAQQLPALTDPGTNAARVTVLFQERAYWLFLTGHRQGDLRRLIRYYGNYGYNQNTVYPIGVYTAPGTGLFGTDVTAPIPGAEYANPKFQGCLNRSA